MHELSVTQGMLSVVLEHAQQAGAKRITRIVLVIGNFSTFVDESVQFYFDIISKGTIAEGAELLFHHAPGRLHCWDCGQDFTWAERILPPGCPHCGSARLQFTGGNEFYVESIEVEDPLEEEVAEE
ncbi:MAG TPA: hydrogenase maturation nickel metallochaperone HypA [Anaerolineae bacterium]|nr:hydrogenase maturation nickel metallochaperone HypA [Anaerolineae bacterium]